MRKLAVILIVLLLLVLGSTAQAADLQEGWYVKIGGVAVWGYTPGVDMWGIDWNFTGGLGNSDPFAVTSPDAFYPQRLINVPQDTTGVAPGTSVYLWGQPAYPFPQNGLITDVAFHWETDYDAAVMRLDLLMYDPEHGYTPVWSQNQSGSHWGIPDVSVPISTATYQPVFRVTVVPESSAALALAAGVPIAISILGRRGK